MEDVIKRRRISFSLSKLECGPQEKSTPGKFAYTCHFQQIGINAIKIEKTGIHFKTDVFAAVAVVDAKAPYYMTARRVKYFSTRGEKFRISKRHVMFYLLYKNR